MLNNRYDLKFGGVWLSELGVRVNGSPDIEIAQRDAELITLPGKDGDELVDNGRYKNVEFTRSIAFISKPGYSASGKVQNFINAFAYLKGYCTLEDTDHPGMYTKAVLRNFEKVVRDLKNFQSAELEFSRQPYWYLPEGQEEQTIFDGVTSETFRTPVGANNAPVLIFKFTLSDPASTYGATPTLTISSTRNGEIVTDTVTASSRVLITNDYKYLLIDFENHVVANSYDGTALSNFFPVSGMPEDIGKDPTISYALSLSSGLTLESVKWIPKWRCL